MDWNIVIDSNGDLLKKAFKWRLKGACSNAEIVRRLNAAGMRLNEKRLHEIFKNPFYCGILVSKILPGEIIEGKHRPIVSKEDFLKINSVPSTHPQEHKADNDHLPLKRFVYCEECKAPLTGFLVKQKGLYYYKCRTKGCSCTKSAIQLHEQFQKKLACYELDSQYADVIKDIMIYSYDHVTKELRGNEANVKRQLSLLNEKIESVEERFAIGEIDNALFQKFRTKYVQEQSVLNSILSNSSISSSNLQKAIDKALNISSNLSEMWVSGDLVQKRKIQKLVFPSGLGYDKSKGNFEPQA